MKLCIKMSNNDNDQQLISIPLSKLPLTQAPTVTQVKSIAVEDRPLRRSFVNCARGSDIDGSTVGLGRREDQANDRRSGQMDNNNPMVPRKLNTTLDREYLPPQGNHHNNVGISGRPRYSVQSQSSVMVMPESEQEANWRNRCEKLSRDNHDLNKVG